MWVQRLCHPFQPSWNGTDVSVVPVAAVEVCHLPSWFTALCVHVCRYSALT